MTDKNDQLISRFMQENRHEIADKGFSRRVMQQLPKPIAGLSNVLHLLCALVCCTLFYVFRGFDFLFEAINQLVTSQSVHWMSNANLQSLLIAGAVLIIIGVQRACSVED